MYNFWIVQQNAIAATSPTKETTMARNTKVGGNKSAMLKHFEVPCFEFFMHHTGCQEQWQYTQEAAHGAKTRSIRFKHPRYNEGACTKHSASQRKASTSNSAFQGPTSPQTWP